MSNIIIEQIAKKSKLEGGAKYWEHQKLRNNLSPIRLRAKMLSAPHDTSGNSQVIQVGGQPDGLGYAFTWDRQTEQALLVVFINAADNLGVSIDGLQPWDYIEVTSATGIASFSEDDGNSNASSIVGIVAAGVKVAATAAGYPEAIPIINGIENYAKDKFKQDHVKNKRRDSWGEDPGTGDKARQEGGVLICLPEANGTYYSGNGDHEERWIKDHNDRTTSNLPKHIPVGSAFFLNRNDVNKMQTGKGGQAFILAWDHVFEDNAGYYKLFVRLSKGMPPVIV